MRLEKFTWKFMNNLDLQITITHSWILPVGESIMNDKQIILNPYDYACYYGYSTKDFIKALDLLKKFIHEEIDRK